MKNKILTIFIIGIFLLSFASATIKQYNEETQTVTLRNRFLFFPTSTIGEVTLLTPLEYKVAPGYSKVFELKVEGFTNYEDFISRIKTYDIKTDPNFKNNLNKNIDLKVKVNKNVLVDDFENVLVGYERNGTEIYQYKKVGEHYEEKIIWEDLTTSHFNGSEIIVSGFTNVQLGDKIEWIPRISNRDIEEWAIWTADLESGIAAWYKLNETSGTVIDSAFGNNATNYGATPGVPGIIGTAYNFTADGQEINISFLPTFPKAYNQPVTYGFWMKRTQDKDINEGLISTVERSSGEFGRTIRIEANDSMIFQICRFGFGCGFIHSPAISLDNWYFVVGTFDGTGDAGGIKFYLDGVNIGNATYPHGFGPDTSGPSLTIGGAGGIGGTVSFRGIIDEAFVYNRTLNISEIQTLYNSGVGCTYQECLGPSLTLNAPEDYFNSTNTEITFNVTVETTLDDIINVTLILDGVFNETNTSGTEGEYIFTKNLADGTHTWGIFACNQDICVNSTQRTLTIDSTSPVINISSPNETFTYLYPDFNLTLNFTVIDENLDTCIWEYNSSNTTISCTNATVNTHYFNYSKDLDNGTLYANDSLGNSNSQIVAWDYKVFENNISFNPSTTEGSTEKFTINLSLQPTFQISKIILNYNGKDYNGTFSDQSGFTIGTNTIAIPDLSSSSNITFFFNTTLSDGNFGLSQKHNQTVNILSADDCSTNNFILYNLTLLDEKTQLNLTANLNTTTNIEINLNIYSSDRTISLINFTNDFENINPARICTNVELENNYSADAVIKYFSTGNSQSAFEYYNILNSTIGPTNQYENISLYALNSTENTEFQLTFRDEFLKLAPNILFFIDREYVSEGTFKTVEIPKTDSNGQAILNLVRNNIRYNLIAVDSTGEIVSTFNDVSAFCQDFTIGSCTINLNARSKDDILYIYSEDVGISYSLSYSNSTELISLDFLSEELETRTVEIETIRNSEFGNRTVCTGSLNSISGTVNCNTSDVTSTDRFLFVNVFVDGDLITTESIDLEQDTSGFGTNGYFIAFLTILFFITMFTDDKQSLLISLALGWVIVIALGLVNGTLFGVAAGGIWFIVCIIILLWKLKKEETGT